MLCREGEVERIREFIESAIQERAGRFFLAGPPGAGKTSSVDAALKLCAGHDCRVIRVNGMAYGRASRCLTAIGWMLTDQPMKSARGAKEAVDRWCATTRVPCVLVFDEMDALLLQRRKGVSINRMTTTFHTLMEWSRKNLIFIGISNTTNLPACTQGCTLLFPAYTAEQLAAILKSLFQLREDSVQFIAEKIAEDSGDIRKALSLANKFNMLMPEVRPGKLM